jgi:hypothetical protein
MEYLEENLEEWMSAELDGYGDDDYLVFDCPGQVRGVDRRGMVVCACVCMARVVLLIALLCSRPCEGDSVGHIVQSKLAGLPFKSSNCVGTMMLTSTAAMHSGVTVLLLLLLLCP